MPRTRPPYSDEYRERILSLYRSGRSVASLARDFEPCAWTIRTWIKKDEADQAEPQELSEDERAELARLRRENEKLKTEREILEKAAAWFAQKTNPTSHSGS
jgi:transposase